MEQHLMKTEAEFNSPFMNTYGGLSLVSINDRWYLRMDDCFGPDYFGPLTQAQVDAFHTLSDVVARGTDGE